MSTSGCPYTGPSRPRQSPLMGAIAVAAVALSLGGCASVGLPFGEASLAAVSGETTGSLPVKADVVSQVDSSDWEAVRRAVASVSQDREASRIEWSNPDTGSTGTVATLDQPIDGNGALCRPFATTVSDVRGVRRYRGEACLRADGRWQLHGMIADDAQFS